jgi:probable F420-dependent oxidoreductase
MTDVPVRHGVTVPLDKISLHAHRAWYEEIDALGYSDLWTSEADDHDGFTPLALAAAWTPRLRLGTAIVPVFTRGPAVLAQTAASMAQAAPGRFALGIGASSPAIVERWNGIAFERAFVRTRDTLRFLRRALTGDKVSERYDTFAVQGFRLGVELDEPPPLLIAALRERMLRLAGEEADGAIVNWLSSADVAHIAPYVGDKEIVARIFVVPETEFTAVRAKAARIVTAYLTVPVYRRFHEWLGRGTLLQPMWDAWERGNRAEALSLVPDEVIDDLFVWGSPSDLRTRVDAYVSNGVTTTAPMIYARGEQLRETLRALAPSALGATRL